jgi:mannitol-1-phosphate 5-dehydrogenase
MVIAVHFGAGNIGRGFIGALLYQSGYHTKFVDVNETIIDEINSKQTYKVILASEQKEELEVRNISGINSAKDPNAVIDTISEASIVTTAVGPNILPIISKLLAQGLKKRSEVTQEPLNIIACENMIGGSSFLKEKVYEHLTDEEKATFDRLYGFPNSAVDRIVPNQTNEDLLTVSVEPYFEWVVEEKDMKGEKPNIQGVHYVPDLKPYIERKLFTVNTGHAVSAYIGYYLGFNTIKEAMDNEVIYNIVKGALQETGTILVKLYGFDKEEHQKYIEKILGRFVNPYISDEVTRVARGPIRKLGPNDRFVRPATLYLQHIEKDPVYLAKAIAAALLYTNDQDEEAVKLKQQIKENGFEKTLQTVAALEPNHRLISLVLEQMEEIKKLKNN